MRSNQDSVEILLEQIEPARNCYRHFGLRIEPDLFASFALVVTWGRIGRRPRTRIAAGGSRELVEAVMARILQRRERHGYVPVLPVQAAAPSSPPSSDDHPGAKGSSLGSASEISL